MNTTSHATRLPTKMNNETVGLTSIGQVLYAITICGETYRSTNYGISWQRREIATSGGRFATPTEEAHIWVDV